MLLCGFLLAAPAAAQIPRPELFYDEEESDEKLVAFVRALLNEDYTFSPNRDPQRDWLAQVAFQAEPPVWYTMTITKRQWDRWQRKAAQWREFEASHPNLHGDIVDRSENLRGAQIAAIVDVLAVRIQLLLPNPVTGFMVDSFKLFETVSRDLPIEFGEDVNAYLADQYHRHLVPRSSLPVDPRGAAPARDERPRAPKGKDEWSPADLQPRVRLNISPRWDLKEPSLALGTGLGLRLGDRCRLNMDGSYDTKDRDKSCELMFSINLP